MFFLLSRYLGGQSSYPSLEAFMSLFGGLGRGIGNIWQGYGKGLVTGVVSQYLGQGAGKIVGGILQNKRDRREMRGPEQSFDVSSLWNQTLTSYGQMSAAGSPGYMADPGLQSYRGTRIRSGRRISGV